MKEFSLVIGIMGLTIELIGIFIDNRDLIIFRIILNTFYANSFKRLGGK